MKACNCFNEKIFSSLLMTLLTQYFISKTHLPPDVKPLVSSCKLYNGSCKCFGLNFNREGTSPSSNSPTDVGESAPLRDRLPLRNRPKESM